MDGNKEPRPRRYMVLNLVRRHAVRSLVDIGKDGFDVVENHAIRRRDKSDWGGDPLRTLLQLKSGVAWGTFGGADLSPPVAAAALKLPVAGEVITLKVAQPRLRALLEVTAGQGQVKSARGLSSSRKP